MYGDLSMIEASSASRRYAVGSLINWAAFLGGVALLAWGSDRLAAALLWLIAIVMTASVAAQFGAFYRLIAGQDEFLRAITAKRLLVAAAVTLTLAVFAGLAVQFLGTPLLPLWLLYPLFWGVFGMVTPLVRSSRP